MPLTPIFGNRLFTYGVLLVNLVLIFLLYRTRNQSPVYHAGNNYRKRIVLTRRRSVANLSACDKDFGYFYPTVALQSFAGSGNTWLRYLIEQSFGYYTGSVYMDKSLYDGGFKGEFRQVFAGDTIAQKIHHQYHNRLTKSYFKQTRDCIILFRSPKEALLSEYKRTHSGKHRKSQQHTADAAVDPEKFKEFFDKKSSNYILHYSEFLEHCENIHVLFYDHLVDNVEREMDNIGVFLQKIYSDEFTERVFPIRRQCLANKEGAFHRHSNQTDKYAVFDAINEHKMLAFNSALRDQLSPMLEQVTGSALPANYYL